MTDITTPHSLATNLGIPPDTAERLEKVVDDAIKTAISNAEAFAALETALGFMITPMERHYAFYLLGETFGQWRERAKVDSE